MLHNGQFAGIQDAAVFCCDGDFMQGSMAFNQPQPAGDVRRSSSVRVTPKLWSVAEARERVRDYAEKAWQAMDAVRPKTGRVIDGETIYGLYKIRSHPQRRNK